MILSFNKTLNAADRMSPICLLLVLKMKLSSVTGPEVLSLTIMGCYYTHTPITSANTLKSNIETCLQ